MFFQGLVLLSKHKRGELECWPLTFRQLLHFHAVVGPQLKRYQKHLQVSKATQRHVMPAGLRQFVEVRGPHPVTKCAKIYKICIFIQFTCKGGTCVFGCVVSE